MGKMTWTMAALAALALPSAATASTTITGSYNGLTFTASNQIIGQTSTATQAPPTPPGTVGNPIYLASSPQYTGVAQLVLHEDAGDFLCTGSLLGNSSTIVTAGHCVSSGNGVITARSVDVYFNNHLVDTVNYADPNSVKVSASAIRVNPLYTGEVIDDHDIALIGLSTNAPDFAKVYQMYNYTGNDLTGVDYNVAGFGRRSDQGGNIGADLGAGRLRQGDNRYDFRLGDPTFGGFFAGGPNGFFGTAETDYSYLADFDDGLAANDASCKLGADFGNTSSQFCNLGRGATEVSTAPGDSGGPQFVNGQIASVTSYGLTFGTNYGDVDNTLNDTFGEFNGFVSLAYNADFLAAGVPEPATWGTMILGIGTIGAALRRRRRTTAAGGTGEPVRA